MLLNGTMGKYAFHTKQTFRSFFIFYFFFFFFVLFNKIMHNYANTLPVNNFTYFKMYLKAITSYKSFIM